MGIPLAGIGGLVKVGANTAANLGVWSLAEKSAVADTTSFGATGNWETKAATLKSWTAKADGRLDPTDVAQLALINGLGTTVNVEFDTDPLAAHKWVGTAIVTGIDPKADVKSMVDVSFSFEGTGPCTFT